VFTFAQQLLNSLLKAAFCAARRVVTVRHRPANIVGAPAKRGTAVAVANHLRIRHDALVDEPPTTNEWERAYQASIEAEHQANLRADELHARQMAIMPPEERRRRRAGLTLVIVIMGPLLVGGIIVDGVSSYRVVSGHAVPGTVVLTRQVDVCVGRPPCVPTWEGRFTSSDGTVDRVVDFAEPVPRAQAFPGANVAARWTSVKPDSVYLAKSGSFRDWVLTTVMVLAVCAVVGAGALVVWRRRARLRRQIEAEAVATTASGTPTPEQ
jgi:hypothetical protein